VAHAPPAMEPAATFSFGVLAAMQDECGFLPGPGYSSHDRERLPKELHDEYVLRTSYHATVVMGFACAMALSSSHVPPVTVCPVAEPEGRIEQILCLLRDESREPRWRSASSSTSISRSGIAAGGYGNRATLRHGGWINCPPCPCVVAPCNDARADVG
jgi:hypothetical protein